MHGGVLRSQRQRLLVSGPGFFKTAGHFQRLRAPEMGIDRIRFQRQHLVEGNKRIIGAGQVVEAAAEYDTIR